MKNFKVTVWMSGPTGFSPAEGTEYNTLQEADQAASELAAEKCAAGIGGQSVEVKEGGKQLFVLRWSSGEVVRHTYPSQREDKVDRPWKNLDASF